MTLAAIAKELNTTTMTIYRRLKRAGITMDQLRDAQTGEVTTYGASVIAGLFDSIRTEAEHEAEHVTTGEAQQDAVTVAVLTERLAAAEDVIRRLEQERDRLITQLEAVNAALAAEQVDRQRERAALLPGPAERPGIFTRLFGRGKDKR